MASPTTPELSEKHGSDNDLDYGFVPFFTRFQEASDTELEIAILQWQLFCDWRDPDSAAANIVLSQLGELLRLRYKITGRADDLHRSIDLHTRTLAVPTLRTPDILKWSGLSLFSRGYMNGSIDDLRLAIESHKEALSISVPNSDDWVSSVCCLSRVLCCADWPSAGLDINRMVSLLQTALELMKPYNLLYSAVAFAHGIALRRRYEILNTKEDLYMSRDLLDVAINQISLGHRERAVYLLEAGSTMDSIRIITRNRQDAEQVVLLYRRAAEAISQNSPDRPMILTSLASGIVARSSGSSSHTDLDDGIALARAALRQTSTNDFLSLRCSNILAMILMLRSNPITCPPVYLDEAIEIFTQLLSKVPLERRFAILINLGSAYSGKFMHSNDPEHLSASQWFTHEALDLRSPGDVSYAYALLALSRVILLDLDRVKIEDLDHLVPLINAWMCNHPSNDESHWQLLIMLACVLHTRGHISQSTCDIDTSMHLFADTCNSILVPPTTRLRNGCQAWIKAAETSHMTEMALAAYTTAIHILPEYTHIGLPTTIQLEHLGSMTNDLPCNAAGCAAQLGDHRLATSLLESGRTVLWNNILKLQNTFADLPGSLREPLKATATNIQTYYSQKHSQTAAEQQSVLHQQELHTHFQNLLHQVREYPGFEDFLLPASFAKLQHAARAGPIILLFSSEKYGSSAIVIRDEHSQPSHILLPDASTSCLKNIQLQMHNSTYKARAILRQETDLKGAQTRLKLAKSNASRVDISNPLSSLWNHIVLPVIMHLGFKKCRELKDRPRVWWCLAGKFASLPIHAAGAASGTSPGFTSDYMISSYTPTLGALLSARSTSRSYTPLRTLILAEPHAQNQLPLLEVFHEVEVIKGVVQRQTLETDAIQILLHPSPQEALENIGGASVVHFACHALQDPDEVLSSGVLFRDSRVTVEDMMRLNIPDAFFAFLSACESAAGDQDRPDEALHLAAAMMFAGFKSVVATLWSMDDRDGPLVAEYVYSELFKHYPNVDPDCIPFALDAAARKLRDDGVHWSRWATYIHMGV